MIRNTESIWHACSSQLKLFIKKRISDPSYADDILQDVFIKIHEKIDSLNDDTKINSWVYQITRNSIVDYYRKHKIEFSDIEKFPETELNGFDLPDSSAEPEPSRNIALGLPTMIKALPEKYAQALTMVELQGMSQVQLAEKLNISFSGAKSRVQRGRQMLKDSLMNCCHYEFDKYGTIISSHPIKCCCCNKYQEDMKSTA